jgi:hypothetical protein
MAPHDGDGLAFAGFASRSQPGGDGGLEALPEQRHLEVVTHAAVHRDERDRAALHGDDAVQGHGGGGDHAPARLDEQL